MDGLSDSQDLFRQLQCIRIQLGGGRGGGGLGEIGDENGHGHSSKSSLDEEIIAHKFLHFKSNSPFELA